MSKSATVSYRLGLNFTGTSPWKMNHYETEINDLESDRKSQNNSETYEDPDEVLPPVNGEEDKRYAASESSYADGIPLTDVSDERYRSQSILIESTKDGEDDSSRQSMFFSKSDESMRIDYVLVYNVEENEPEKERQRDHFEDHLTAVGVKLEHERSSDGKLGCVKIHCPWTVLTQGAKLLKIKKKLRISKEVEDHIQKFGCFNACSANQKILPDEEDFFTAPFDPSKEENFAIDDQEDFFTVAERSLIAKMFLDITEYAVEGQAFGKQTIRRGIDGLIHSKVYAAAFPLHEGRIKKYLGQSDFFEGRDKDRLRLHYGWAKPSNAFRFQPLDYIRRYFGEKIAMYFAWLGVYTMMLIPASLFGLGVFLYGLITLKDDQVTLDICGEEAAPGNYTMCPLCDKACDFQPLSTSCIYARLTHVFDNYATPALALFMSVWALIFLEVWKREQAELQFMWDVADFENDERFRPEYEQKATHFKFNPVTEKREPYTPWYSKCVRRFTSMSLIIFLVGVVLAVTFSILIYRLAVAATLFALIDHNMKGGSKLITTVTSSVINLILIAILSVVYRWIAIFSTNLEMHKTFTEHEDSYTFKMIVFQFINFYGSIIYIAYFKGSFIDPPGKKDMYVFGMFRQDECDPSGCFIELTIQLVIIMVGKQLLNSVVEIIIPFIKSWIRRKGDDMKHRTRWEDDYDLGEISQFVVFDEYLEMVIQFGFVTLFVTAFPLAPLCALINNIIEIRLDAYKALHFFRRPTAIKAQDIGAWYSILKSFAYIAVITNAFIMAWTSDFIPKLVYIWTTDATAQNMTGYIDYSLSRVDTYVLARADQLPDPKVYKNSVNVTECRFRGYRNITNEAKYVFNESESCNITDALERCNQTAYNASDYYAIYSDYIFNNSDPCNIIDALEGCKKTIYEPLYEYKAEYWQIFFARMAFVIVFEHACFALMSIVAIIIPDVSAQVKRMRRYERLLTNRLMFEDSFTDVREKRRALYLEEARFNFNKNPPA